MDLWYFGIWTDWSIPDFVMHLKHITAYQLRQQSGNTASVHQATLFPVLVLANKFDLTASTRCSRLQDSMLENRLTGSLQDLITTYYNTVCHTAAVITMNCALITKNECITVKWSFVCSRIILDHFTLNLIAWNISKCVRFKEKSVN